MAYEISIPRKTKRAISAEEVCSIDDVLMLILLCLPVKSLMRFKLVSPLWKSLITSLHFSLLRNPDPNPAVGLFFRFPYCSETEYIHLNVKSPIDPPFRELYFPEDPDRYWIQQSCNGLLVCCNTGRFSYKGNRYPVQKCYIHNPTSKQFIRVPIRHEKDRFVHGVALAFDRTQSPPYKVFSVVADFGTRLFQIEKYSSGSGVWSFCGKSFRSEVLFNHAVYWDNTIHWIDYSNGDLLYFNVHQETIRQVPGPSCSGRVRYFGESCDHLLLIKSCGFEAIFNIYEMRMDHSEWFVKYQVVCICCCLIEVVGLNITSVFAVVLGKEVEDSFVVLRTRNEVIRFNFLCQTFEEIFHDHEPPSVYHGYSYPGPWALEYIESLVSV